MLVKVTILCCRDEHCWFYGGGDTLWWCSILGYSSYQLFRLWASPETGHETEPLVEFKVGVAIPDVPDLLQIVRCGYRISEVDLCSEIVIVVGSSRWIRR